MTEPVRLVLGDDLATLRQFLRLSISMLEADDEDAGVLIRAYGTQRTRMIARNDVKQFIAQLRAGLGKIGSIESFGWVVRVAGAELRAFVVYGQTDIWRGGGIVIRATPSGVVPLRHGRVISTEQLEREVGVVRIAQCSAISVFEPVFLAVEGAARAAIRQGSGLSVVRRGPIDPEAQVGTVTKHGTVFPS